MTLDFIILCRLEEKIMREELGKRKKKDIYVSEMNTVSWRNLNELFRFDAESCTARM